jgi:hypothetical protein
MKPFAGDKKMEWFDNTKEDRDPILKGYQQYVLIRQINGVLFLASYYPNEPKPWILGNGAKSNEEITHFSLVWNDFRKGE